MDEITLNLVDSHLDLECPWFFLNFESFEISGKGCKIFIKLNRDFDVIKLFANCLSKNFEIYQKFLETLPINSMTSLEFCFDKSEEISATDLTKIVEKAFEQSGLIKHENENLMIISTNPLEVSNKRFKRCFNFINLQETHFTLLTNDEQINFQIFRN